MKRICSLALALALLFAPAADDAAGTVERIMGAGGDDPIPDSGSNVYIPLTEGRTAGADAVYDYAE